MLENGSKPRIAGPLEEGPHFDEHDIGLPGPRARVIAECFGRGSELLIADAPDLLATLDSLSEAAAGALSHAQDRGEAPEDLDDESDELYAESGHWRALHEQICAAMRLVDKHRE